MIEVQLVGMWQFCWNNFRIIRQKQEHNASKIGGNAKQNVYTKLAIDLE